MTLGAVASFDVNVSSRSYHHTLEQTSMRSVGQARCCIHWPSRSTAEHSAKQPNVYGKHMAGAWTKLPRVLIPLACERHVDL